MDVRVELWRNLSTEELLLLNCGVGEDSWESFGLQGDPTSPSFRKSVLGVHWKAWSWSWNSSTLATSCQELTHWKDSDAGRDWGQEEKGTMEDKMAGWHHRLDGHEFGWTPGVARRAAIHGVANSWTRLSMKAQTKCKKSTLIVLQLWLRLLNDITHWAQPRLQAFSDPLKDSVSTASSCPECKHHC